MKRDMDLGRKILLELEGEKYDGSSRIYDFPIIDNYSESEIEYHVGSLQDAGLLLAEEPVDGSLLIPQKLTWQGHEFLDAARNQNVWEKVKGVAREQGGSLPFDILKALAIQFARQAVGL